MDKEGQSNHLNSKTAKSGFHVLIGSGIGITIRLGAIAILARLIDPANFGVFALSLTIPFAVEILFGAGSVVAIVAEKMVNSKYLTSFFIFNFASNVIVLISLLVIINSVKQFFPIELNTNITMIILTVMSASNAFSTVSSSLLRREMKYLQISIAENVAAFLSAIVGIGFALYGFEEWALAYRHLALMVFLAIGYCFARPWIPTFNNLFCPQAVSGIRNSIQVSFTNLINNVVKRIDPIILSYFAPLNDIGAYNKAVELNSQAANSVMLLVNSFLSPIQTISNNRVEFEKFVLNLIKSISFLSFSLFPLFAVLSDDIIRIVLGPGWDFAGVIFAYMTLSFLLIPIISILSFAIYSQGKFSFISKWNIGSAIIICCSLFLGAYLGSAIGMARALFVTSFILRLIQLSIFCRKLEISIYRLARFSFVIPGIVGLLVSMTAYLTKYFIQDFSSLYVVGISLSTVIIMFGLIYLLYPPFRFDLLGLLRMTKSRK